MPLAAIALALCPGRLRAGGGPEERVAGGESTELGLADGGQPLYLSARNPASNVVHVFWNRDLESTDVETFRTQLLGPVLKEMTRRGLGEQIDHIVWSCDFPFRINVESDLGQLAAQAGPTYAEMVSNFPHGSLTG